MYFDFFELDPNTSMSPMSANAMSHTHPKPIAATIIPVFGSPGPKKRFMSPARSRSPWMRTLRDGQEEQHVLQAERPAGVREREPDGEGLRHLVPELVDPEGRPEPEDEIEDRPDQDREHERDDDRAPEARHERAHGEPEGHGEPCDEEQEHERDDHLGRGDPAEEKREGSHRREDHDVEGDGRVGGHELAARDVLGSEAG